MQEARCKGKMQKVECRRQNARADWRGMIRMGRKGLVAVMCAWMLSACVMAPVAQITATPSRIPTRLPASPATLTAAAGRLAITLTPSPTPTRPPASVTTVTAATGKAVVTPSVPAALQTILPPSVSIASCAIQATRTPAPSAPTFVPSGVVQRAGQVDPHVEICAGATRLKVGDRFVVLGVPVDVGLPIYTLSIKDGGATEAAFFGVDYNNKPSPSRGASRVPEVEAVKGEMRLVAFVVRAREPGSAEIHISASGEIHYGYPGPATWAGGGSESLSITVEAR